VTMRPSSESSYIGTLQVGCTAIALLIARNSPSAEICAGQSGQMSRMVLSHCFSLAVNLRAQEYSIEPSWRASPNGPKTGMNSGPFAVKHRYESHT